ncbi:MAG: transcriptional regulator [Euryarchaeota archaeon]|nr:transcriptional regulator [Euryarchaeota archaeon]
MPASDPDENDHPSITEIDRLIHEPARLMIMAYLYVVESADFLFLMRQTGLTHGNLSSHMSKLESAGYIEVVKEFVDKKPHTMLRLTDAGRDAFQEHIDKKLPITFLKSLSLAKCK